MVRLSILALALLLLAAPVRAQSPTRRTSSGLFARALELQQAGDLLGAIDTYKAALAIIPDRADALSNLGAAYVRLGQFDDAIKQYEAALKADPTNNAIRLNLALAYYKSARPNEAIPQLKRVVASDPEAEERLSGAGRLLPADRAGPGSRRAAEAARADVRRRSRVRVSARHRAAAHRRHRPRGRSTSIGCSAPASRPRRTC